MRFDVVVFDFDGTLVSSAALKKQAFYAIFPPDQGFADIVSQVLSEDPDGSRLRVIPEMCRRMATAGLRLPAGSTPEALIGRYGEVVLAGVAECPEMVGATDLLRSLTSAVPVYVASNTPDTPLRQLLERRGWARYLSGSFGYPHSKADTLRHAIARHNTAPERVVIVGDGISDADAARQVGCAHFAVEGAEALLNFRNMLQS
ncbi:HAD family hydrolase [Rhodoligotrophos defluvii]|uniref:HAD family hydrolase n=1 Tax=Rhodoligotrophos defluvii TaxID=2561934 RepID=UPI0010CA005B|nr:HAD family hydrolase [Rhodoligotrophos defluvii]